MRIYRLRALTFVGVAFILGCNEYTIVGVLPDIAREFQLPLTNLGFLVTAFALVYAFLTPILTSLITRWSRRRVLLTLLLIFLLANSWSASATTYWSLLLSRMLAAGVAGTIISLVLVLANFIAPLHRRTALVAWVFAGFNIAAVVGVPIGTFISTTFSWHASFWLISLATVPVMALLFWLVPQQSLQARSRLRKQFTLLTNRQVILGLLFTVFVNAADYTFYTYIRPLITKAMGFGSLALNLILFFLGICSVIGNILGGRLTENGNLHRLTAIYLAATLSFLLLGSLCRRPYLACLLCGAICILIACYGAPAQMLFMNVAEKYYPQSLDLASSLCSIFANLGIALGSVTAAHAVSVTSVANIGYFAAVYSSAALISIWALARRRQQEKKHLPA